MARRRPDPAQQDLFADQLDEMTATVPPENPVAVSGFGGQPDVAAAVLNEIMDGRYGFIEKTGRVVEVDPDRSCRFSEVEDTILHLEKERYIELGEMIACRHGAIIRQVTRYKLTKAGTTLRKRWASLKPRNA
ncbi:hypothetical protein DMH04_30235 [Kibdelosporangium aridum]|uniref:DNA-binding protein n=1 Tax=Kibdelosporangium aridum TaxID=2030 RepID=A0A428Z371_KIBAR|nr:hypothetical protein [Kibdelosporangium aridum]RSM80412.1 hypothetical protein DMH04_30235 [Kibdelosporangium aridum]